MTYLLLFYEFFKAGLFAVGGGLATIPFLTDMAGRYTWFTTRELANMIAVAESTPGPIGINCATYAGYNAAGIPGALCATFALVLPSFIVITLIARALNKYRQNKLVDDAFTALRPAATGLIGAAAWSVIYPELFASGLNYKGCALFAALLVLTNLKPLKNLHPLVFIGVAAAAGLVFGL